MRRSALAVKLMIVSATLVGASGCSWFGGGRSETKGTKPVQVSAGSFYQPTANAATDVGTDAGAGVGSSTQPAVLTPGAARASVGLDPVTVPGTGGGTVTVLPGITDGTESLTEKLLAVPPTPVTRPSDVGRVDTVAATPRPVRTSGTYMTLGGMIAEVNGTPIFANKVIKALEPALEARAKEVSAAQFQQEARRLIDRQVGEYIRDELLYAAAQRNLDQEDRKIADAMTTEWRERRIRDAGGSLELAKRRAQQDGEDFDELLSETNRRFLVQIFQQKKIGPRIAVTTNDMRRYYRDNVTKQYSTKTKAAFRVIYVDPARSGGKDAALKRIQEVEARAKAGEDFAKLASEVNDNSAFKRNGGEVAAIDKGNFVFEKVEEAVFATEPGQLTPIVEDRGGFFLAKVTSKTAGEVKPFESQEVQRSIENELRRQQYGQLEEQYVAELKKGAVTRTDERMMQTALDMANQRYAAWRGE